MIGGNDRTEARVLFFGYSGNKQRATHVSPLQLMFMALARATHRVAPTIMDVAIYGIRSLLWAAMRFCAIVMKSGTGIAPLSSSVRRRMLTVPFSMSLSPTISR